MFLVKRDNFNKNFIIKGFITSILFSAFIYLNHFGFENKILITLISLLALYFLITIPKKSLFYAGFFVGIFWFYWIAISLKYYEQLFLVPVLLLIIGLAYGLFFYLFAIYDKKFFRALAIFLASFIAPFGFNWLKIELLFVDSYLGSNKEDLALILVSLFAIAKLKRMKILALIPLFMALNLPKGEIIDNPNINIAMPQFNIKQNLKWEDDYRPTLINKNLLVIDKAIKEKKELIILPETAFPTVLNRSEDLLNTLKEKSFLIDIYTGSLYEENEDYFNATYFISKGEIKIAKKVVLVPFGEEIPLPQFFVDLINNIFYGGAKDYSKAEKATDFIIKNEKIRNAICYEATSDKIYENLNDVKYLIAISNNAWFTPSIEPTLQKLLLKYYAKKHKVTIFHSINGSENYIIRP